MPAAGSVCSWGLAVLRDVSDQRSHSPEPPHVPASAVAAHWVAFPKAFLRVSMLYGRQRCLARIQAPAHTYQDPFPFR